MGYYYVIPWSFLNQYLQISKHYDYILAYDIAGVHIVVDLYATYGGLTPEDALKNSLDRQTNIMNQQFNQLVQINENFQQMLRSQQSTTSAVSDLNDTMIDDTVTSGYSDLPSNNTNDITRDGINNIFQSIYNAFCTGSPQNIVFPIPFTNQNITLSPYYVRDMLTNFGATWVYTLIQAFWGYLIGRFIIKDVSNKINKIKSGNIEEIEKNNIKEDML